MLKFLSYNLFAREARGFCMSKKRARSGWQLLLLEDLLAKYDYDLGQSATFCRV